MDEEGRYDLITITVVRVIAAMMKAKMLKATKHLLAHFFSVRLSNSINSSLSASVLVGSQFSGALRGEMRMMIPAIQKSGNTEAITVST